MLMMKKDGLQLGRFKVRMLMREMNLISKQTGSHAYKKATAERPDIPNVLNREFAVVSPNQVWCGDIHLGRGPLALSGSRYRPMCAPSGGLGVLTQP